MSIEQTDVVDAIGVEVSSGKVILTISDHLDWSDEKGHMLALQNKINTYLRFIESSELVSVYPEAKGREQVIDIVARVSLSEAGEGFFREVQRTLEPTGIQVRFRVLHE